MSRPSTPAIAAMLCAALVVGACSRSAEKDPGNQTTSASTGTAGARGTSTGQTNPATPSGVSGTADRTGATAPSGTTGIIGSSGGVPRNPDDGPKIGAAGSPGSPQNGAEGAGASGSSNSATGSAGTAGTLLGSPGMPGRAAAGSSMASNSAPGSGSGTGSTDASSDSAGSAGSAASATNAGAGPLSSGDKGFVNTAAASGLFEVQAAQLAASRASSTEVKAFATMLVNQHVNANNELAQLAAVHGIKLPAELPGDLQTQLRKLQQGASKQFDRDFVQATIKAHERDVATFEKAGEKVQDPQLKAWIEKTLPSLRQHLEAAQLLGRNG